MVALLRVHPLDNWSSGWRHQKGAGVYAGRGAKGSALRGKLMILTGTQVQEVGGAGGSGFGSGFPLNACKGRALGLA